MILEVYGLSKEELDHIKWEEGQGEYLGDYDGLKFKSNKYKVEQLEKFDFLHVYIRGEFLCHSPERFNKDISAKLEKIYVREFGKYVQTSLL